MSFALIAAPIVGILALIFAFYKASSIDKVSPGNDRMIEISTYIQDGAMAFLRRQYRSLIIFVVALFVILILAPGLGFKIAITFLVGASFSMLAGFFGMKVATKANVRTANSAMESGMNKALNVAFSGGSVMG
ncbi:MAG: sodium/proton-translocating pyrophosphatase, partial [Tissierellaceae bacterium]